MRCDCDEPLLRALLRTEDTGASIASTTSVLGDGVPASEQAFELAEQDALLLDDAGRFSEGLAAWRRAASDAQAQPEMISAAAGMLATASSNRALAGRCADALALAHEASLLAYGGVAAFHIALSGALCPSAAGSETTVALARLEDGARASAFPVMHMLPLIHTAQALAAHRPEQALTAISLIPPEHDAPPPEAYLRGLSLEMDGRRAQAATALHQAAERHGYSLLTKTIVAPLAAERLRHP